MGYFDNVKNPPPAEGGTITTLPTAPPPGSATKYAAAALRKEAEAVAVMAPNSGRNDALNRAYFRMGRHVGAGNIDAGTVRATLAEAGRACGLPQHEIDVILRDDATNALDKGATLPRHPAPLPEVPSATILGATEGSGDPGPPLNPIIDWHELFAAEDDGEEWIVEPILPARRMIALYSAPKAGKSLLMLEIAVGIARGTEVIGVTPDRPRRVLYVDFENDPRGDVRARLESMEVGPGQLKDLCYLTYPSLAKFDTAQGAIDLARHVEAYECEVVVIDTVSRAVMGDENENDTWLSFYRHTGLTLKRMGVACIRLDHSGKDREKGMRGGSAKYGDVDAVWRLTAISEDTITLECTDNRMPVPVKLLTLTRQDYPLVHVSAGEGWQIAADAKARRVDEILDRLGVASSASVREASDALRGAGEKTENRALREAVKLRKMRLDVTSQAGETGVPRHTPAHLGTPGGSVPGTPPPLGGVRHTSGTVPKRHGTTTPSTTPEEN